MPPTGPRSRANAPSGKNVTVRNEAFESIFGRPAGGHHVGPSHPPPPRTQASGHGFAPTPGPTYLNPAQPSYPPGQGYLSHPPPRPSVHHGHGGQPVFAAHHVDPYADRGSAGVPFARPPPRPFTDGMTDGIPHRRASLDPNNSSAASSPSYYTPSPDPTASPHTARPHRMPPSAYPPGSATYGDWDAGATPRALPDSRLPPAGILPQSQYDAGASTLSRHPTVPLTHSAFPPRSSSSPVPGSSGSSSNTSLPYASSSRQPFEHDVRSPISTFSHDGYTDAADEELARELDKLGFNGRGAGPLDELPGLPRRGETSGLGNHGGILNGGMALNESPARATHSAVRQQSISSAESYTHHHQRAGSDASVASSDYTLRSNRGNTYMTSLSQIDQSPPHAPPSASPQTPTASDLSAALLQHSSARKSMDSTQSLPLYASDGPPPPTNTLPGIDSRAESFSGSSQARQEALKVVRPGSLGHASRQRNGAPPSSFSFPNALSSQRSLNGHLDRAASIKRTLEAIPPVYPALLSKVAEAFKQLIDLSELVKDGLSYKDSFDGRMAVTIIAEVIKTPDRNLALLLGRALDSQKFFHDVTYDHRLRDNPHEIYQFRERLTAPFMSADGVNDSPSSEHVSLARNPSSGSVTRLTGLTRPPPQPYPSDSGSLQTSESGFTASSGNFTPASSATNLTQSSASPLRLSKINSIGSAPAGFMSVDDLSESEDDLPVGVFTLLTDCYSPTCSSNNLCYSINCPRRLEQMKRLNMKPTGLSRKLSEESLHDVKETGTLWIQSVSQEILDSVDDREKKRQEAINEVVYTERDFVRDLEYLRDSWVKPLRSLEVIDSKKRDDFVRQVFWNVHDVLSVNHVLADRLTKRQKQQPVVQAIGDLFLERIPHFEPFVTYGAHQMFGKYEFEKEKGANPAFQQFVDETERKPESRKLELNGYLTKPTTRLGRYPLLLGAVLKYTPDDHQDHHDLSEAIKMIRAFLTKVNIESGKSENIFELAQIEQQLVFRPGENLDLRLRDKSRELVYKGPLKRRGGSREEIADLVGFLFDHAFLLVKPKWVNKAEQFKVYRRPIPLELLVVLSPDDQTNAGRLSVNRNRIMATRITSGKTSVSQAPVKPDSKHGFSLTMIHLGKRGYSMQLWVDTFALRKKWLESIDKQQHTLRERSTVFTTETITEGHFTSNRRLNCVSPYDNGNRMIYGTDEGVYFSNLRDTKLREPVKVVNLAEVTQVDVLEEFQLLIVLHERQVTTFPLDCLDPNDPNAALKRAKRISSHTSFFKSGICLGKTFVAVVKSSALSSTIKVLEPIDQATRAKKPQTSFMKRLNVGSEPLKLYKEFYIPTESSSVHFLKTKLCVGTTKGFEIVDLETLDMQGLLDPSDASLDFVLKRDNVKPIAIYRIEEDFLLCYDEFAFYVNKNGWRSRPKWAIIWEGVPTGFALQYPYVIAFEPTFVEIHNVESGHLVQIIPASSICCLFADTPPSRVNAPPPSRALMFPPQSNAYRPPPAGYPGYPQQPFPPQGYKPNGGARPPPGGFMLPPPVPSPAQRFARPQIIFNADEGHVQFLKLAPPNVNGDLAKRPSVASSRGGHAHRASH